MLLYSGERDGVRGRLPGLRMTDTAAEPTAPETTPPPAPAPAAPAKPPAVWTHKLTKRYGTLTALDALSLELDFPANSGDRVFPLVASLTAPPLLRRREDV